MQYKRLFADIGMLSLAASDNTDNKMASISLVFHAKITVDLRQLLQIFHDYCDTYSCRYAINFCLSLFNGDYLSLFQNYPSRRYGENENS